MGHKGRGVKVVGRLKQDRWNGPDGKQRSKVTIVAEHVEFRPEFKRGESAQDNPSDAMASSEAAASEIMVDEDIEEMASVTF
jgi:single-strand DNA-binding protein